MKNKELINTSKTEDFIILTLLLPMTLLYSFIMLKSTIILPPDIINYVDYSIYMIFIYLNIRCLFKMRFIIAKESIIVLLASIILLSISIINHNELLDIPFARMYLFAFVAYHTPALLFLPHIKNFNKYLKGMYVSSYFIGVVGTIVFVLIFFFNITKLQYYSMAFGDKLIMPTMFILFKVFKEKKTLDFVFAFILFLLIVILGSRYPILSIGSFAMFLLLSTLNSKRTSNAFFIILVFVLFGSLFVFGDSLANRLNDTLYRRGISSRTVNKFISGTESITNDSGRSAIHKKAVEKINKKPIWGYGAFGDLIHVRVSGAHSVFYNLWVDFGGFFGSLILLYYAYMSIKSYRNHKGTPYFDLILIYSFMIWPRSTVSSSFWQSQELWILMALFIARKRFLIKKNMESNSLQPVG